MGAYMAGTAISVLLYIIVAVAVYKVFQMATDVAEIKEILKDIRQNTDTRSPGMAASGLGNLAQAIEAENYLDRASTRSEPQH